MPVTTKGSDTLQYLLSQQLIHILGRQWIHEPQQGVNVTLIQLRDPTELFVAMSASLRLLIPHMNLLTNDMDGLLKQNSYQTFFGMDAYIASDNTCAI